MTTLYYSPGSCSLVPHVALEELAMPLATKQAPRNGEEGRDAYLKDINPMGAVPALVFDDGRVITQNLAIVDYMAGQTAGANSVLAAQGTYERAQAIRWLSFANSDIHPLFGPLFAPSRYLHDESQHAELKENAVKALLQRFALADAEYQNRDWIAGEFSAADTYLYVTMRWAVSMKLPVEHLKAYRAMVDRIQARGSVQRAMAVQAIQAV